MVRKGQKATTTPASVPDAGDVQTVSNQPTADEVEMMEWLKTTGPIRRSFATRLLRSVRQAGDLYDAHLKEKMAYNASAAKARVGIQRPVMGAKSDENPDGNAAKFTISPADWDKMTEADQKTAARAAGSIIKVDYPVPLELATAAETLTGCYKDAQATLNEMRGLENLNVSTKGIARRPKSDNGATGEAKRSRLSKKYFETYGPRFVAAGCTLNEEEGSISFPDGKTVVGPMNARRKLEKLEAVPGSA